MPARRSPENRPTGVVLLVVLVVIALLSIVNLAYYDWTFAERKAADAATRQEQALLAAESAVEMLKLYLSEEPTSIEQDGGLWSNPGRFRAMLIADGVEPELRVRASVVAPMWGPLRLEGARFGLEDDSGRLNLNTLLVAETRQEGAARDQLMALPGMTEAIADAILDWLDDDDTPRTLGAERDYYSTQTPPYAPANGPLATIEQLLLVKDVTPELLWGVDVNRNAVADTAEVAGVPLPVDNSTGALDGGWASMLTLYSAEANVQPDGTPKINVNADDLEQLHADIAGLLGEGAANFVVAFRQGGPEDSPDDDQAGLSAGGGGQAPPPSDSGGGGPSNGPLPTKAPESIQVDFDTPAAVAVQDLFELVGVTVRVVEKGELSPTLVESPWQEASGTVANGLTDLMQTLTTTDAESIPGRVNINTAPRPVLAGVPGMPLEAVDAILASRDPAAGSTRIDRLHASWLLAEGYLDLETMRDIAPYVTGQGAVYRAQVVGGYEAGGPVRRLEVVLDTTASPPRIALRRDLSPLGAGFDPALTLSPTEQPIAP
ncbi:hypothetical protein [Botrimarina sp.]|uniref:general secretion pathway protein GspK n=1 Tax=Botrimarina sp. TaxID=2795802 RepID=UPI0032EEC85A